MDLTLEINEILKNAEQTWGTAFFKKMTEKLGSLIQADYIFIGKINKDRSGVDTTGLWGKTGHLDDFYYDLVDTPCRNVANDSTCIYAKNVTQNFPGDQLLIEMKIEGYIGTPLKNSRGEVFALLVALFKKKISHTKYIIALFEVFAGRISAELEREERERQLNEMNRNLETLVNERTNELQKALDEIDKARKILVEKEKISSLGTLVSGVAHEVNTPLGVAITAASSISLTIQKLENSFRNASLKKSELVDFIEKMKRCDDLIMNNLNRSATLISNFKKIAVNQEMGEIQNIVLKDCIDEILDSLEPLTEKRGIFIENNIDAGICIRTDPGTVYQIFSNLLMNAFIHGFNGKNGKIKISSEFRDFQTVISVENDGLPIPEEIRDKIFEPFVTTKRNEGGTGLGLHIAYNLVSSKLGGHMKISSAESPVRFEISLKKTNEII